MTMKIFLTFIFPPLVGAVIGLFTNWLAIKMLFRPMKEIRILGIKVPFTPGILPRERYRLAESIGDTVAGDLLTEEVLTSRIRSEEFRKNLENALLEGEETLATTSLGDAGNAIDPGMTKLVRDLFSNSLESIASTDAFAEAAKVALEAALAELYNIPLDQIFGDAFWTLVSSSLENPESREKFAGALTDAFLEQLKKNVEAGTSLSQFIKFDDAVSLADRFFDFSFPFLIKRAGAILNQKKVRESLEKAGALVIRRTLERMNSVQRFFIGIGGYEKTILENMPETISDFTDTAQKYLLNPDTAIVLKQYMHDTLETVLKKPLRDYGAFSSEDSLNNIRTQGVTALTSLFNSLSIDQVSGILKSSLANRRAGDVFAFFPGLTQTLTISAVGFLSSMFESQTESSKAASRILGLFLNTFYRNAQSTPIGVMIGLTRERAESVALLFSAFLTELAADQSARILKSVDIRNLVRDRINDLDMVMVERIILKVMDKELQAVTWFGALLGGIMGLGQTILALMRI